MIIDTLFADIDARRLKITDDQNDSTTLVAWIAGEISLNDYLPLAHIPLIYCTPNTTFSLASDLTICEDERVLKDLTLFFSRLGSSKGLELLLLAETLAAQSAVRAELVDGIATKEQFKTMIGRINRLSISAIELALEVSRRTARMDRLRGELLERYAFALRFTDADQREGMSAFLEKRSPKFPA